MQGKIHSIQNKQILLEFNLPGSGEKALAKLIPGFIFLREWSQKSLRVDERNWIYTL